MKFILTPNLIAKDADIATEKKLDQLIDLALGGFFYDYLRNQSGQLVGVRYWGMSDLKISEGHLRGYIEDPRFLFDKVANFVDIVFYAKEIADLQEGRLNIDIAQDFGGDSILDLNGHLAILFDLVDE